MSAFVGALPGLGETHDRADAARLAVLSSVVAGAGMDI